MSFDIPIINDNMLEKRELFTLSVLQPLPNRVTFIKRKNEATVTIVDNDRKWMAYIMQYKTYLIL